MGIRINAAFTKRDGHNCAIDTDHAGHGVAIDSCTEDERGHFWVSNGEYASMVSFCPHCGAKAPTPPTNTPRSNWLTDED